jgi:hypothetical protein
MKITQKIQEIEVKGAWGLIYPITYGFIEIFRITCMCCARYANMIKTC